MLDKKHRASPLLWGLVPICVLDFLLFLLPMSVMVIYSFWVTKNLEVIPYSWTWQNYLDFFQKAMYTKVLLRTVWIATAVTLLSLLLGYPFAYFLVRYTSQWQKVLLMLVIIPFWTSFLIRTYAWMSILGEKGVLNQGMMWVGLLQKPLSFLLYNQFAVILVGLHLSLPFTILTLYATLEKFDFALVNAAKDLGATPFRAFLHVTLPQTMPGIFSAILFVFIPTLGLYITPVLVGGTNGTMIVMLIVNQFKFFRFGMGSAIAFTVTFFVLLFLIALRKYVDIEKIYAR